MAQAPQRRAPRLRDASRLKTRLAAALAVAATCAALLTRFLNWAQVRPGVPLDDFLLRRLPALDCSVPLFVVLYALILYTLFSIIRDTNRLITGLYAISAVFAMRAATITLFPLAPPVGMVSLRDPFVRAFFGGNEITKDLFFSGHVATAVLMILLLDDRKKQRLLAPLVAAVAVMLLVQHAHYTVDILAAPVFGGLAYRFGAWMCPGAAATRPAP